MADANAARILVVDDTEGNRYAASRILRSAGFEVLEAATGREALEAMREEPDLVVLDINLPDMTGYQVAARIREMNPDPVLPVVHLSASYTSNQDRVHGLEQGADAYLTHPLDAQVFVATVRALLRSSAADRRLADAAREWQATFDALTDAVFLLDTEAMIQRANRVACALVDVDGGRAVGCALLPLFTSAFGPESANLLRQLVAGRRNGKTLVPLGDRTFSVTSARVQSNGAFGSSILVLEDVSERIAAEREREDLLAQAREARREAESANQSKSDFLAVMSHELRTPLNAIGGYAQLMQLGIRGPISDAQRADLSRIMKSQSYLLSLINDVLNFAKIESGHAQLDLEEVALADIVSRVNDFIEPQMQERSLMFVNEGCPPDTRVVVDAEKVQQILLNLISNALKFTPAGGRISLRCIPLTEGGAVVAVEDSGPGMAAAKLERIFEPFMQLDRRYTREREGIGLGLAISRELALAMGGGLTVRSEEGCGSTFELTLPGPA